IDAQAYAEVKENLGTSPYYAVLYIPRNVYSNSSVHLLSFKQIPLDLTSQISRKLSQIIETDKRRQVVEETGIPDLEEKLAATSTRITVNTLKVSETGEAKKSSSIVAFMVSYAMGFIIYFFVFMYGSMVMNSVMEEKKNRIVEVIISSVKPFQLMAGKIIGTALVGLTQVAIWIVVGFAVLVGVQSFISPDTAQEIGQSVLQSQEHMNIASGEMSGMQHQAAEMLEMINNLNLPLILFGFIFYFLAGYLLYSSLLGSIGAAVDNPEDSQQFVLPITLPLILSIILLVSIVRSPDGPLAFWSSIIPLTSPICMLARIPYGIPAWELILSMALLILTVIGAIWVAAKIYRTGILMYGKKITFKELFKWLVYKG
ncbi:MAG: ABC transporter permease, partial [Prolixibacteraceae bacterium]|nr:ABC transporter permease [Prolixibacteraceae bacterium]